MVATVAPARPSVRLRGRWAAICLALGPTMQWTAMARFLVPGDLVVLPFVILGLLGRDRSDAPQMRLRRRLAIPAVTIAVGSVLALLDIGPTPWAINTLLQDVVVACTFVGVLSYSRHYRVSDRWVVNAVVVAGLFVAVALLVQGGYRPSATFGHPNMAAHFLASCFVLVLTRGTLANQVSVLPVIVAGVAVTGSFGALLSMGVVAAYVGYGGLRRLMYRTSGLLVAFLWSCLVGGGILAVKRRALAALSSADSGTAGLSADRLARTSENRSEIWLDGLRALREHPLGIGPGGFKPRAIHPKVVAGQLDAAEIHHDLLGYLVERGFVGLAGLVILLGVLWSVGRPQGATRGLLLMTAVAGFFRETLHFRHLWIFMALAVAYDLGNSRDLPRSRVGGRAAAIVSRDAERTAARAVGVAGRRFLPVP